MGKSKRRDRQNRRIDPKAGKPSKPPKDPELAAIRTDKILPVIAELENTDSKKRSNAITAIANLVVDQKCRKLLLREQLVRIILTQTLSDANLEIQARGWGILHKLLEEENLDFGLHLYRQDVLTPLNHALGKIKEIITSTNPIFSKLPKSQQSLVWDYALSLIGVLSHVSEVNDEVFEAVSKMYHVLEFLFSIINSDPGPDTAKEAMSCLYTLTEDASYFLPQLLSKISWLEALHSMESKPTPVGMAACGVSFNISMECHRSNLPHPKQLGTDTDYFRVLVISLKEYITAISNNTLSVDEAPFKENPQKNESPIHLALEILSSIAMYSGEENETEVLKRFEPRKFEDEFEGFGDDIDDSMELAEEGTKDGDDDESQDSFHPDDMDVETGHEDATSTSPLTALYDAAFISNETLPLLVKLATLSTHFSLEVRKGAIKVLTRVFFALSSAESLLPASTKARLRRDWAPEIWKIIISPALAKTDTLLGLATSITKLAFSLLVCSSREYISPQDGEVEVFMGLYNSVTETLEVLDTTPEDEFGATTLEVLSRLAVEPCPVPTNQAIASFLMNVLINTPKTPVPDVIAALDGLFLVYADKAYSYDEPVFRGQNFLSLLDKIKPNLVKLSKSVDGRKEPDLKGFLNDGVRELGRFIKYKEDELAGKV